MRRLKWLSLCAVVCLGVAATVVGQWPQDRYVTGGPAPAGEAVPWNPAQPAGFPATYPATSLGQPISHSPFIQQPAATQQPDATGMRPAGSSLAPYGQVPAQTRGFGRGVTIQPVPAKSFETSSSPTMRVTYGTESQGGVSSESYAAWPRGSSLPAGAAAENPSLTGQRYNSSPSSWQSSGPAPVYPTTHAVPLTAGTTGATAYGAGTDGAYNPAAAGYYDPSVQRSSFQLPVPSQGTAYQQGAYADSAASKWPGSFSQPQSGYYERQWGDPAYANYGQEAGPAPPFQKVTKRPRSVGWLQKINPFAKKDTLEGPAASAYVASPSYNDPPMYYDPATYEAAQAAGMTAPQAEKPKTTWGKRLRWLWPFGRDKGAETAVQ